VTRNISPTWSTCDGIDAGGTLSQNRNITHLSRRGHICQDEERDSSNEVWKSPFLFSLFVFFYFFFLKHYSGSDNFREGSPAPTHVCHVCGMSLKITKTSYSPFILFHPRDGPYLLPRQVTKNESRL
jgi:hypothetical protein